MKLYLRRFVTVVVATYMLSVFAMRLTKGFGLEKWHLSVALLAVAACLYGGNFVLTRYFITRRAPQFASEAEALSIVRLWELTTGKEVVPKWISLIGLLSISVGITAILPWVGGLLRWGIELLLK